MLAQAISRKGFDLTHGSSKMITSERLQLVAESEADVVCVSVVAPTTVSHARYLCLKLRESFPTTKIVVGLWDNAVNDSEAEAALQEAGADVIVKSVGEALRALNKLAIPLIVEMKSAPVPENDDERVAALTASGALASDSDFRSFTDKLCRIFETPIAMLSLVDGRYQHFKAETGLPESVSKSGFGPRSVSICGHVVANAEMIVVEDLARDRRFANNPFVKDNGFRFYAGAPVRSKNGHAIGSLCIIDTSPREFTQRERRLFQEYANDVSNEIIREAGQSGNPA